MCELPTFCFEEFRYHQHVQQTLQQGFTTTSFVFFQKNIYKTILSSLKRVHITAHHIQLYLIGLLHMGLNSLYQGSGIIWN